MIVTLVSIKTMVGRSVMRLVFEVFGFNVTCCGVAYYGIHRLGLGFGLGLGRDHSHGQGRFPYDEKPKTVAEYWQIISEVQEVKRKLFFITCACSFILGMVPAVSI